MCPEGQGPWCAEWRVTGVMDQVGWSRVLMSTVSLPSLCLLVIAVAVRGVLEPPATPVIRVFLIDVLSVLATCSLKLCYFIREHRRLCSLD